MGSRDYRHREPKKTKKEAKKISPLPSVLQEETPVEVVKTKGKKEQTPEE